MTVRAKNDIMQKMEQIEKLTAKAKALHAKIIFPEADKCERIRDAIDLLLKEDICGVCHRQTLSLSRPAHNGV